MAAKDVLGYRPVSISLPTGRLGRPQLQQDGREWIVYQQLRQEHQISSGPNGREADRRPQRKSYGEAKEAERHTAHGRRRRQQPH